MKKKSLEPNCICSFCGKSIYKKPSHLNRYKYFFCDMECKKQYQVKHSNRVKLKCDFCGNTFYRRRRQLKNSKSGNYFCDNICKNRYLAINERWRDGWEKGNPKSHKGRQKLVFRMANKRCQVCGFDKDIRLLDVHHYDGDHHNNRWGNLRCLCVMCHAKYHRCNETSDIPRLPYDISKMKNILKSLHRPKRLKKVRIEKHKRSCKQSDPNRHTYPARQCGHCKKIFAPYESSAKFCSVECAAKGQRKAVRPSKEELEKMIEEMSWCAIGRKYEVSDNAVRKWARQYKIDWKVRPYNKAPNA